MTSWRPWLDHHLMRTDGESIAMWMIATCTSFALWQQSVWAGICLFCACATGLKYLGAWLQAEIQALNACDEEAHHAD